MTASDPTAAGERWRTRTPELHKKLVELLRRAIEERGHTRVVLGLSGGLDSTVAAVQRLRARGLWVSAYGPRTLRAITHLDVDDAAIERAGSLLRGLGAPAGQAA